MRELNQKEIIAIAVIVPLIVFLILFLALWYTVGPGAFISSSVTTRTSVVPRPVVSCPLLGPEFQNPFADVITGSETQMVGNHFLLPRGKSRLFLGSATNNLIIYDLDLQRRRWNRVIQISDYRAFSLDSLSSIASNDAGTLFAFTDVQMIKRVAIAFQVPNEPGKTFQTNRFVTPVPDVSQYGINLSLSDDGIYLAVIGAQQASQTTFVDVWKQSSTPSRWTNITGQSNILLFNFRSTFVKFDAQGMRLFVSDIPNREITVVARQGFSDSFFFGSFIRGPIETGSSMDEFGRYVQTCLDSDGRLLLFVGAPNFTSGGIKFGRVFVWKESEASSVDFSLIQTIMVNIDDPNARAAGFSLDVTRPCARFLFVGCPEYLHTGTIMTGAILTYERDDETGMYAFQRTTIPLLALSKAPSNFGFQVSAVSQLSAGDPPGVPMVCGGSPLTDGGRGALFAFTQL